MLFLLLPKLLYPLDENKKSYENGYIFFFFFFFFFVKSY